MNPIASRAALQGEKATALDLLRQIAELLRTTEVGTGPDPGKDPDQRDRLRGLGC